MTGHLNVKSWLVQTNFEGLPADISAPIEAQHRKQFGSKSAPPLELPFSEFNTEELFWMNRVMFFLYKKNRTRFEEFTSCLNLLQSEKTWKARVAFLVEMVSENFHVKKSELIEILSFAYVQGPEKGVALVEDYYSGQKVVNAHWLKEKLTEDGALADCFKSLL